jgi:hypothetical protein
MEARMKSRLAVIAMAATTALMVPPSALADAIDGDWCSEDGRRISIQGPSVVTPGGTKMRGSYTRHSFDYTTPPTEPDAGQEVAMRLLNETTVQIRTGKAEGAAIWHRCTGTTS